MLKLFNKANSIYTRQSFIIQTFFKICLIFFSYIGFKIILYAGFFKYIDTYDIPFPSYNEFDITLLYPSFYTLVIQDSFYSMGICLMAYYGLYIYKKKIIKENNKNQKFKLLRYLYKVSYKINKNDKSNIKPILKIMAILFIVVGSIAFLRLLEIILNNYYLSLVTFLVLVPIYIGYFFVKNQIKINFFIIFLILIFSSSIQYYTDYGVKNLLDKMNIGGEIPVLLNYQNKKVKANLFLETKTKLYYENLNEERKYNDRYITVIDKKDILNIQIKKREKNLNYMWNELKEEVANFYD